MDMNVWYWNNCYGGFTVLFDFWEVKVKTFRFQIRSVIFSTEQLLWSLHWLDYMITSMNISNLKQFIWTEKSYMNPIRNYLGRGMKQQEHTLIEESSRRNLLNGGIISFQTLTGLLEFVTRLLLRQADSSDNSHMRLKLRASKLRSQTDHQFLQPLRHIFRRKRPYRINIILGLLCCFTDLYIHGNRNEEESQT